MAISKYVSLLTLLATCTCALAGTSGLLPQGSALAQRNADLDPSLDTCIDQLAYVNAQCGVPSALREATLQTCKAAKSAKKKNKKKGNAKATGDVNDNVDHSSSNPKSGNRSRGRNKRQITDEKNKKKAAKQLTASVNCALKEDGILATEGNLDWTIFKDKLASGQNAATVTKINDAITKCTEETKAAFEDKKGNKNYSKANMAAFMCVKKQLLEGFTSADNKCVDAVATLSNCVPVTKNKKLASTNRRSKKKRIEDEEKA